jgi:hypothetical protein
LNVVVATRRLSLGYLLFRADRITVSAAGLTATPMYAAPNRQSTKVISVTHCQVIANSMTW